MYAHTRKMYIRVRLQSTVHNYLKKKKRHFMHVISMQKDTLKNV